jgi:peptide/nickel transport system substrate-binding protein
VTSRDVVWSLNRFRDSANSPTYSLLLRDVASVSADGPGRVVVGFRRAYAEQLFDAVYHVWPLPAHLLDTIPASRLAGSPLVARPVGSGPYRWGALQPGQRLELTANREFFLGRPKIERVVFLFVRAAEAQLNLVLDGTADALEAFLLPRQIGPIVAKSELRLATQPSLGAGYLLFNQKAPGDRTRPHPILADPVVRRAIAVGIDRPTLLRNVFGPYGGVIDGPMGGASWVRRVTPKGPAYDAAEARRLLASRGWRDGNGDGILEKDGAPLTLRLAYPVSSIPRVNSAEPIQEMLRRIGVGIELTRLEGPVWAERRGKGEFDIDYSQTILDPTPSGLVQSWSCAGIGGTNVGSICDPRFDTALGAAIRAGRDAPDRWREAIGILQGATPAVFLYSPMQSFVIHRRFKDANLRVDLPWSDLWRWSVEPDAPARR